MFLPSAAGPTPQSDNPKPRNKPQMQDSCGGCVVLFRPLGSDCPPEKGCRRKTEVLSQDWTGRIYDIYHDHRERDPPPLSLRHMQLQRRV